MSRIHPTFNTGEYQESSIIEKQSVPTLQIVYTIGYEGLSFQTFLSTLQDHDIEHVIDIRRNPISRKSGFSKKGLQQSLYAANIQYTHLIDLGTPNDVRKELKETLDYENFFKKMDTYLSSQTIALQEALELTLNQKCTLLCFERNPEECHRMVVAAQIAKRSNLQLTVEHIEL